ncbi:unnamed protein product [Caenorhabditis auriculariae]|uniref:Uncharacterized protein n=1 Tax=Caenorhabditis auriculariae TaxID=2777116 RepID=A0A8S1GYJ3_9PELO|nr:unnamed protein product [Caenorhabditis auriculariae]
MRNVWWDLAVGGVDENIEGNGGEICMHYIPGWQRFLETIVFVPLSLWTAFGAFPLDCKYSLPPRPTSRYTVLTIYSLIFGAELAYKMISKTGIFLLNPCHVTTTMQLILLTMDANDK